MLRLAGLALREPCGIRPGDALLVGVSGGADSVALAYLLAHLRTPLGLRLTLAHLHHGLRGADADADEAFVRLLAGRLGLEAVFGRCDVAARAARTGESVEMAARAERRAFFRKQAAERGTGLLALAHTADDQAETVLLRLARGAGPRGLGAMPWRAERDGLVVVRPFLGLRREALRAFLTVHGLRWREDASNQDDRFLRVRVRREVLPLFERRLNPASVEAICRAAALLRDEAAALDDLARAALRRCSAGPALRTERLQPLPQALRRRVLLSWLTARLRAAAPADEAGPATGSAIERLQALVAAGRGRTPLRGALYATVRSGRLEAKTGPESPAPAFDAVLPIPGALRLPGGWRVRIGNAAGFQRVRELGLGRRKAAAWIRKPRPGEASLRFRAWLPGDRYRPLGAPGSRKLQDLFTDAKLAADRRIGYPVLVSGEEIVWLPGHRVAQDWAVAGPDAPSLYLRIERKPERAADSSLPPQADLL
jgi:tRNA(Ile)-lysidine synthase